MFIYGIQSNRYSLGRPGNTISQLGLAYGLLSVLFNIPERTWLTSTAVTFSSAIVLLASLKSNSLAIESTDTAFQAHWTRCISILDHYEAQVPSAAHASKMLRAVQRRMFNKVPDAPSKNFNLSPVSIHIMTPLTRK
jgi:hypothetical protein